MKSIFDTILCLTIADCVCLFGYGVAAGMLISAAMIEFDKNK